MPETIRLHGQWVYFSFISYKQTIMKKVEATDDVVEIGKYVKQLSAIERCY